LNPSILNFLLVNLAIGSDLVGGIMKRRVDEIRALEKEIALLESACFIEK